MSRLQRLMLNFHCSCRPCKFYSWFREKGVSQLLTHSELMVQMTVTKKNLVCEVLAVCAYQVTHVLTREPEFRQHPPS